MSISNIVELNYHKKLQFRRYLLKNAQKRYAQKLAFQIKNKAANDNMFLKNDPAEGPMKIY